MMDCPCCDGLGMIGDPLRAGRLKRCPECDTPPSAIFLPLAAWLGPPDEGERELCAAQEEKRLAAVRAEDAAVAAHAAEAAPDCGCGWCTVQPRAGEGRPA
jgi:hypothetical protein